MKERDAFEQMDRSAGLRRERRGSPGRSAANAPAVVGRSFAVSGAISNDDDDSTDGEPMPGITRRQRPHKAPYRGGGHKLAQQSGRPSREVSMADVTHDDTSEGESTPTHPPPPPNMPPPPSVIARAPPLSLPSRDRRQSTSDDDNDYSTEAEMTRLNQRAFVPSRRRHSPSRNTGRRQELPPSRSTNRYSNQHAGTGRRSHFSPDRSRGSRGREHSSTAQHDPAVIVMPSSRPRRESDAEQLNYDSALSF